MMASLVLTQVQIISSMLQAQSLPKEAKKDMRSAVNLPGLEVFRGARGPEPGSGLDRFHCEGIPVMLAPVSQLIPTPVMAVLSAAKVALVPAVNACTDQYAPSQGTNGFALQLVPSRDMPIPSAAITDVGWLLASTSIALQHCCAISRLELLALSSSLCPLHRLVIPVTPTPGETKQEEANGAVRKLQQRRSTAGMLPRQRCWLPDTLRMTRTSTESRVTHRTPCVTRCRTRQGLPV